VRRLPDAAGEAAYTAQVFPPFVSYITGWMMLLAYFIVCPWEAVAVGKLAAYLFPQLDTMELYRVAGQPVFLPRLLFGVALTAFLSYLNYRGIRASATFQNWATSALLAVFLLLVRVSAHGGSPVNWKPLFSHSPFLSILLTLQIVPYFLTGFESVPKVAEEAHSGFPVGDFFKAIAMALLVGAGFYVLAVGAVAYIAPWQSLVGKRFATAIAFEQGTHSVWLVRLILGISLVGLLQVFNGNFVASSRLLFAFGRRGTIAPAFAKVHLVNLTPTVAIMAVAGGTLVGLLLGDSLLVPVSEVGSMAAAFGWFAACISFFLV
jgi:amino acid transporter